MKITAPAGNIDRFYTAINSGADEVYMGLKGYGARRNAENFTVEEMKEAIDYAHERGSRVLLTLNTIMKNNEIDLLYGKVKSLYEHGLDAIIVQDLGFFKFLKENFPKIDYHASTQMTVANHFEINYLEKLGFKRVVLPRELSLEEIREIKLKTNIELEVFVSGALCVSYSGNCYMSSLIGGRSGNRGMCAQPCRKRYENSYENKYLLSLKDQLIGSKELKELEKIGINSIKIEGRMKQSNYIYEAINYFKNLLEHREEKNYISSIFNRGYSKGYFNKSNEELINKDFSFNVGEKIGTLSGKKLKLEKSIVLGDGVTYYSKELKNLGGEYINKIKKINKKEKNKEGVKGEEIVLQNVPKGSKYVFKNYDKKISLEIERKIKKSKKFLEVEIKFLGKSNKKPVIEASCLNIFNEKLTSIFLGEKNIEKANKKSIKLEEVLKKLNETGETSFKVKSCEISLEEGLFLPTSVIKDLRRKVLKELKEKLIESYRRKIKKEKEFKIKRNKEERKEVEISAVVTNTNQEKFLKSLGIKKIYKRGFHVAREKNTGKIDLNSNLASNLFQILANKTDNITVNWNLNIANTYCVNEISKITNVETVILSPELSYKELENIGEVPVRKAVLGYSKILAMYVEENLLAKDEKIIKSQKDEFILKTNKLGNGEIYFKKSLNILSEIQKLEKIGIDEIVIELLDEDEKEIELIFKSMNKKRSSYSPYNYERGVL